MSAIALVFSVLFIATLIAAFLARNSLKELVQFLNMDNNEKEVAIKKMQDRNQYRSSIRDRKVSGEFNWVLFFFGLSAFCGLIGLGYTCGYSAFWGALVLANAIEEQVRIFIANYGNPNVVEGTVFEFRAAA